MGICPTVFQTCAFFHMSFLFWVLSVFLALLLRLGFLHGAYLAVGTADNEARSPKDVQLFWLGLWRLAALASENLEHFSDVFFNTFFRWFPSDRWEYGNRYNPPGKAIYYKYTISGICSGIFPAIFGDYIYIYISDPTDLLRQPDTAIDFLGTKPEDFAEKTTLRLLKGQLPKKQTSVFFFAHFFRADLFCRMISIIDWHDIIWYIWMDQYMSMVQHSDYCTNFGISDWDYNP